MKKIIQIDDSCNDVLTVNLKDILNLLPTKYRTYCWSLFEIEAAGSLSEERPMPEFENEVLSYPSGMPFSWIELSDFSNKLESIINITIAGNQNSTIKPYEGEHELIQSSEILIEFFDSSYWRIYTADREVLEKIKISFSDTKILKYPDEF